MAPARWSAATAKFFFGNPFSPFSYTLPARMISASADVFSGVAERRGKPAWNVPETIATIDSRPFGDLIRFERPRTREVPRVLLVAPLSGHYATLLRGTVESLIDEHDVYITDWTDARDVPVSAGSFDLDDYIGYLMDWIRLLGPDVHVIGVCQPVPAVLSAVALMAQDDDPAQPRSMVLMGGPLDVDASPTAPTKLAANRTLEWFDRELTARVPSWYRGAGRRVYPGFLQLGAFVAMHPDRHIEAHLKIFNALVRGDDEDAAKRRAFYDEYLSVMDIPAEFYLQTVDVVFKRAALMSGTMTWRGRPVDPAAIARTALMTVEGELDDISGPGQTFAAHGLTTSILAEDREHLLQPGVGHYGVFNGRRYRESIYPRIAEFIAAHV
ncbi:esterase [Vulcanimicrobium alpinum]|uniref:Esterase n=2 Tax=Vulcanimicrobium alpinum TaxID=3016050 RepID=A0AAN1XTZ3_UNVUL|nr:esterase [Vulcanimicrobium alpinum]